MESSVYKTTVSCIFSVINSIKVKKMGHLSAHPVYLCVNMYIGTHNFTLIFRVAYYYNSLNDVLI